MKIRKLIAVALASATIISMTGCSFINNTIDKTYKAVEELGYQEEKAEKYLDELEDMEEDTWEDGLFTETDDEDIIKELIGYLPKSFNLKKSNVNKVLFAKKYGFDDHISSNSFSVYCFEMKDTKTADKLFDNIVDTYEDFDEFYSGYSDDSFSYDTEVDDDYFAMALELESGSIFNHTYMCAIKEGKVVTFISVANYDKESDQFIDMLDDLCKDIDIKNPKDLL